MLVSELIPLDKRRCKVLTEEGFAFVLYRGEIARFQIKEGCDLPEETYREIVDTILKKRARERLCFLLKSTARTEQELRRKLLEGGYPKEVVEAALSFGREYHYIDDEAYVANYLEYGAAKKSRRQIQYELSGKGVDRELIARCLEETGVDEESRIAALLKKKGFQGEQEPPEKRKKLTAYLCRKGFSYEAIGKVMGQWEDGELFL